MKHNEAIEVLETIRELYPSKFEVTERKVKMLIPPLMKMDLDGVMRKLSDFASANPFPPTIADIAVYLPEENDHLLQIRKWEQEASQVSEETKRFFQEKLNQLVKEKFNDTQS